MRDQVLIVDDDRDIAKLVQVHLSELPLDSHHVNSAESALSFLKVTSCDLILLDILLPEMDGLTLCRKLKDSSPETSIVLLTSRSSEMDRVIGLEMGADDYITKPVRARVLLARIRGFLRREQTSQEKFNSDDQQASTGNAEQASLPSQLTFSGLVINEQSRVVTLDGEQVKVSSNEFDVLWFLAKRAGHVVSREELVTHLRGFDYDGFDRSIDLRISRLRKKLNDNPAEPYRIKTIWGKGYLFANDSW